MAGYFPIGNLDRAEVSCPDRLACLVSAGLTSNSRESLREAGGKVVDPADRPEGFHDDQVDLIVLEDGGPPVAFRGGGKELGFARFDDENAGLGLELAQIASENFQVC